MSSSTGSILIALLLALGGACSNASSTSTENKNTNWLERCSTSADCADAAACTCGICTIACESSAACAESQGTCALDLATTLQCGGSAEFAVCLEPCAVAADCDDRQACVQGACVTRVVDLCAQHAAPVVCSSFDTATPADWVDASSPDSPISSSSTPRFSGMASLLARTSGNAERSRLIHDLPAMTSGTLYLRAWAYMSPGSVVDDVHTIVVGDANNGDYGTKLLYSAGKLRVATPTMDVAGTIAPPFGRWYCLRLELGIGDAGSVRAFVDDELFAEQEGVDTLPATGMQNVSAGIDFAGQTEPAELYLDDLLIDTQPLDCWR